MTSVSSAREATKDLMSKQETPNAATPPPASCLASGFISGSWPLGLRRSSLLGEGEPHGAEQDEVPASRTPCLPTFSAFAGEQEGWVARCLGTAAFPPGKEGQMGKEINLGDAGIGDGLKTTRRA